MRARVDVAGRAPAGTTVVLDGGCDRAGCQALTLAGDGGRWSAPLRVAGPRARITASTADSAPLDTVTVRVRAPAQPAAPAVPPAPAPRPTPPPAPDRVVLVGDSLAVGIENLLPQLLSGRTVSTDALTGRPLADGMSIIARTDLTSTPTVLAVSLFTNDGPTAVPQLRAAVGESLAAVGDGGCAVWATIVRPPVGGVSYAAANAALRALQARHAPKLVLVPWAETVARQPALLAADGVHGTPEGYGVRAQLYAQAIESCSP